jgi:UDP-glucose 4-epimerase
MKALVTGGAGFIGSHVADALLAGGHTVEVLDNLATGKRERVPAGVRLHEVDVRDGDAVRRIIDALRPDVVCHQAAQASVAVSTREPIFDAQVNVLGSIHLLQACVAAKVGRFVFASTGGAIYGEVPEGQRATEATKPAPASPYACSKFATEAYLEAFRVEHGLAYTVLRYANVYGPRQDPHGEAGVVAIFARRLLRNEPIQINARAAEGDDGCVRDYVYIDDVVDANLRAARGEIAPRVANVASGSPTTTLELADKLKRAIGSRSEITRAPRRPGDLQRSVLQPAPGSRPPTPLDDGLRRTIDWFRSQGTSD